METLHGHITVAEAARRAGLTRARVKYLVRKGRLAARKPGRDLLITDDSLEALLGGRTTPDPPVVGNLPLDGYVTVPQAAQRTGLTPGYFVNLIHRGRLEAERVGRDWFIKDESFQDAFGERTATN